jgi:hypothetical protein
VLCVARIFLPVGRARKYLLHCVALFTGESIVNQLNAVNVPCLKLSRSWQLPSFGKNMCRLSKGHRITRRTKQPTGMLFLHPLNSLLNLNYLFGR